MSQVNVAVLLQPEVLRLIDRLDAENTATSLVAEVESLRQQGFSTEVIHNALEQVRLRRKARAKFGPYASQMLFTEEGLEQATRLQVAAHHAGRFRDAGFHKVGDLGCGLGGDSMALAAIGLDVLAVEADLTTAALASYNLQPLGVDVVAGDALEVDVSSVDAVWIDPARRLGTTRLSDPQDWSPSLDEVFRIARTIPAGIKLAPGMDRDLIPEGVEAQWVSVAGEVVELVVWSGELATQGIGRSALIIGDGASHSLGYPTDSPDAPCGPLGSVLYEPDGAVIRARLIGEVARLVEASMLDPTIAYFSSHHYTPTPFATAFAIEAVLPLKEKEISRWLRQHQVGVVEIKKRGVDIDPAQFRRKLSLEGHETRTLILTRYQGSKVAIATSRLDSR